MAYSRGGIIAAADYNGFVGGATTPTGTINYVWSTGFDVYGYGQTALPQVSATGLVTATQWATAINTLNSISKHQIGGSGTGIGAPTAGTLINYLSTLSTNIGSFGINQFPYVFASQGSTTTGTNNATVLSSANGTAAQTFSIIRTATFASADQARYFFNAGGKLNFVVSSGTNTGATNRGADLITLAATNLGTWQNFGTGYDTGGAKGSRTGTGGSFSLYNQLGYYFLTTSNQTMFSITSTVSPYTGDILSLFVKSSGTSGSNGDKGNVITFELSLTSAAQSTYPAPPSNTPGTGTTTTNTTTEDAINITINNRIDVIYPETTNLSNSWGTVTIA
jgi:hypothetical protein